MNTLKKGQKGEALAEKLLQESGWQIIEKGNRRTAWDLRIKDGKDVLAVNVKVGDNSYGMHKRNLERLLKHCVEKAEIPAYLFILGKGYALFSFEQGKNIHIENISPQFISNYDLVKT